MSATDWPALLPDVARRLLGEPDATESGGATWRYGNRGILGGARRWSLPDAVPTSAAEGRCAPTAEQWTCAPRLRADSAAAWCAVPCSAPPGASDPTVQMDLFAPAPGALCGAVTAPAPPGGTKPPPRRSGAADGALAPCPVVGAPVCYRGDCRHWSDGCRHPDAGKRTRRRRKR